ncbi:helix-turn-helix domain-containing protein [Amycolatopsis sp. NPDC004079]|uniref:LexA family protein n=1 Tax=Amycolatopsis sp. NPDC004079 TaxID=3154549 RepID=UPI0033BA011F
MTVLTQTQEAVLHFIRAHIKDIGYPPTVREIADGVHLRSVSSVHHHLRTLEDLGFIRRDHYRPRGLVILSPEEP